MRETKLPIGSQLQSRDLVEWGKRTEPCLLAISSLKWWCELYRSWVREAKRSHWLIAAVTWLGRVGQRIRHNFQLCLHQATPPLRSQRCDLHRLGVKETKWSLWLAAGHVIEARVRQITRHYYVLESRRHVTSIADWGSFTVLLLPVHIYRFKITF